MFAVPEKYRVTDGPLASDESYGNNGMFKIRPSFTVIASDGYGWEHVSASLPNRCPTWAEMCRIKNLFWSETDLVVQIHPPKSEHVNFHPYCLHLWRKSGTNDFLRRPPSFMVGPR